MLEGGVQFLETLVRSEILHQPVLAYTAHILKGNVKIPSNFLFFETRLLNLLLFLPMGTRFQTVLMPVYFLSLKCSGKVSAKSPSGRLHVLR